MRHIIRTLKLALFSLLSILITACSSVTHTEPVGPADFTSIDSLLTISVSDWNRIRGRFDIKYAPSYTTAERARLERNIVLIYQQWEKDFSYRDLPYLTVEPIRSESFINSEGHVVWGTYYPITDLIQVIEGDKLQLTWFYHELCHVWKTDRQHSNRLWPLWDNRAEEIGLILSVY